MGKLSRRAWLGGMAGALGTASLPIPWFEAFGSSARAQIEAPKRFVVVMGALGIKMRRWVNGTPGSYNFGAGLAALEPYRDDITVFRGLQARSSSHTPSTACFLSGDGLQNDTAKGATIDQIIAAQNGPSGAAASGRIVRSIQAGVGVRGTGGRGTMVYEAAASPLFPTNNPATIFDELFLGGTPSGPDPVNLVEAQAAARQSILDAHVAELGELRSRGSSEDRVRLDQHLDGIRSIETELELLRSGGVSIAECTDPVRYDPMATLGGAPYDRIANAHSEIIGRAFACDITRVATMQIFYDGGGGIGLDFLNGRHAGIANKSVHDNKHDNGAASDVIDDWYAEVVAHLLDQLSAPDPLDPMGGASARQHSPLVRLEPAEPGTRRRSELRSLRGRG